MLVIGQLTSAYSVQQTLIQKYPGPWSTQTLSLIRTITYVIVLSLFFDLFLCVHLFQQGETGITVLDGALSFDRFNVSLQILIQILAIIIQQQGSKQSFIRIETYLIALVNQASMCILFLCQDWLITVVSWEQFNLSLYQQVSTHGAFGANVKYFLQSAYTTSLLLLSIGQQYGNTGATSYDALAMIESTSTEAITWPYYQMQITFLFKQGAAPQHNWAPDLYDSLPLPLTQWMVTQPKAAVLFFLSLVPFTGISEQQIWCSACQSQIIGSIGQGNQWKQIRFQAYSSISNLGFILQAYGSGIYYFYTAIYIITTILIFAIIFTIQPFSIKRLSHNLTVLDLGNIYQKNSATSYALAICLFSQAGCPPQIGFFTKLLVLVHVIDLGLYSITFLIVLASVISACNYLSIIKTIYFTGEASKGPQVNYPVNTDTINTVSYKDSLTITSGVGIIIVLQVLQSNTQNLSMACAW